MAELSSVLFSVGVILVAVGFAAHVGHAVMLANGRRALPVVNVSAGVARQPAYAGVVTGSFVTVAGACRRERADPRGLGQSAVAGRARAHLGRGRGTGRLGPAARDRRRTRTVGQHVRVHGRVLVLDARRLPDPGPALPDPRRSGSSRPASRSCCCSTRRACHRTSRRSCRPSRTRRCSRSTSGWRCSRTGSSRPRSRPASAYLVQGPSDRFAWLPSHKVLDEVAYRAVIIGFPIFATMIILGLVVGVDRVVALLGLGPQGDRGARDVADLRGLPARAQPALVGRPAGRAAARRRVRDGPRHLLGVALVQRPARLLRALITGGRPTHRDSLRRP